MTEPARSSINDRDDEDAAAVLAVLFAISGVTRTRAEQPGGRSIWGDPGHRIAWGQQPSATAWWASGMPR